MPRPQRCRRVCKEPVFSRFAPDERRQFEPVVLTVDEFEVIRLVDLHEKTHEQCARQMDISRSTVTEIYESARKKLAECLVYGKELEIRGGRYQLCGGAAQSCCGPVCRFAAQESGSSIYEKGDVSMRIAVTYENGQVFQHFGHTAQFKFYDVQGGAITASRIVDTNGSGHGALAGFLAANQVDTLICGGIGGGAQAALAEAGVELCSGAEGDVDAAVEAYLNGTLTSAGATCDHHDHEEGHSCGGHCGSHEEEESSCGGSCGTCGGGCGAPTPVMEGKNVGKTCRTHYRGTFNDGTQFDSSYDRGEPLEFICGVGQMIRGFDAAVAEMEVGEKVNIHLMPEEAYGMPDPNAIFTVAIAQLPGAEEVEVGQQVYLQNQYGQPFPVKVTAKDETNITFDANHEMAGKELNFEIELVEVK